MRRFETFAWPSNGIVAVRPKHITSRHNPLVKHLREVASGRVEGLIFVEGVKLVEEALRAGLKLETVVSSDALAGRPGASALVEQITRLDCEQATATDAVLRAVCEVETHQGIAAAVKRPQKRPFDHLGQTPALLVIAHQLQDPGNVGTIIRTVEAAGATGLIATKDSADPFGPKALRAAMGSAFRLPIESHAHLAHVAQQCKVAGIQIVAADAAAKATHVEFDWKPPVALLLGREGSGLDAQALKPATTCVRIPMAAPVESLNVAAAAAVLLFEAARQRGTGQRQTDMGRG